MGGHRGTAKRGHGAMNKQAYKRSQTSGSTAAYLPQLAAFSRNCVSGLSCHICSCATAMFAELLPPRTIFTT